jgi:predicted RNA methylase
MKVSEISKENKRFWEKCFRNVNFDFKSSPSKNIIKITKMLQKYNVHTVLDLGCGFGRWSVTLA